MSLSEIKKFIEANDNFAIIGHTNPDGDCVGSCMGLWYMLKTMGKSARVIMDTEDVPPFLRFIWNSESSGGEGDSFDAYIALDCAGADRLARFKDEFCSFKNTACIDHHRTNVGFAGVNAIFPDAAATGEIIYRLATEMSNLTLTAEAAKCIYTAIASDTGGFKYSSTTGDTLRAGADLLDLGLDSAAIHKRLFDTYTLGQIQLISDITSTLSMHFGGKVAVISVTDELLSSRGMRADDADFLVSLPRSIEGVEVGVFLKKRGNDVKVSLRSGDSADVSEIAARLGGGGHIRAAGITLQNVDTENAKEIILGELKNLF